MIAHKVFLRHSVNAHYKIMRQLPQSLLYLFYTLESRNREIKDLNNIKQLINGRSKNSSDYTFYL